jgi:hypothetical protein
MDLSQVEHVDSTFVGLLLGRARVKGDASVPKLHLLDPSEAASHALRRMHVLQLFDVCDSISDPPTRWRELSGGTSDRHELADLVIDAHEHLIDADGRNAEVFRRVVEGFRAERRKSSHLDEPPTNA